jgi:quercetin dioxygenase-like cupin family protein
VTLDSGAPRDIEDSVSGQRWVFRRTGEETGGELLEAHLYVSAGGFVRSHAHPIQEETFTGVEGTFVLDVGGETRAIGPGETVVVPPRTPHGFREAPGSSRLLVTVRPALALDDYFRAYLGLSRDGRIRLPAAGLPRGLLQIALLMDRFAPEIAAPGIPLGLQRRAWSLLAALGRKRGLKASFPEYGAP